MTRGKKSGRPINRAASRQTARIGEHNERRKILVFQAQSVTQPCAHARKSIHGKSSVHLKRGRRVIITLGEHRPNKTDVVRTFGEPREQTANPRAAFAVTAKLVWAFHHAPRLSEKPKVFSFAFQRFAVEFFEFGFV